MSALRVALVDNEHPSADPLLKTMLMVGCGVTVLAELPSRAVLKTLRPNVLLIDSSTLEGQPRLLARRLRPTPDLAIVAYTGPSSVAQRVRGLQSGIDGWIEKPCHPLEAIARIQAILRPLQEARVAKHGLLRRGELEVRSDRYDVIANGRSAGLTTREFEVLRLLVGREREVLAREQIYTAVWGQHTPAGTRSVDIYVSRIRGKLESVSPKWSYLHTHFGVGYRFAAEPALG